jgi:hypothetical protein
MRYCTLHSTSATFRSPVSARLGGGRGEGGLHARPDGAEAELHLQLAADRHLGDPLDEQRDLHVQPGVGGAHVGAKALHHGDLVRLDLVPRSHEREEAEHGQSRGPDQGRQVAAQGAEDVAPGLVVATGVAIRVIVVM